MIEAVYTSELKDNPRVSVAMTTFNGEAFVKAQVDSILSQDLKDIELIIADDASTDGTLAILEGYRLDGRVSLYKNLKNLGVKRNFENVIGRCSGEYIALADQDDTWRQDKLRILVENIGDSDLIHSDAIVVDECGEVLYQSYSNSAHKPTFIDTKVLLLNGVVTGCTCLFKRSLIDILLPFPDGCYIHDRWISLVAHQNNGITYSKEKLVNYRQHCNNVSGANAERLTWTSVIAAVVGRNREPGILQHYSFAAAVEQRLVDSDVKNYDAVMLSVNFYRSLRDGHILLFIKSIMSLWQSINPEFTRIRRALKLLNLLRIVFSRKLRLCLKRF